tara:strand:- start:165 stop:461 length:297 start_codon:yes stop_codon:yes gene_type:complete
MAVTQSRIETLLASIVQSLPTPDQQDVFEPVLTRLLDEFHNPKTSIAEQIISKNLTDDEYLTILFFPDASHGSLYPLLLSQLDDPAFSKGEFFIKFWV